MSLKSSRSLYISSPDEFLMLSGVLQKYVQNWNANGCQISKTISYGLLYARLLPQLPTDGVTKSPKCPQQGHQWAFYAKKAKQNSY